MRIRKQNHLQDWSAGICTGATLDDLSDEAIAVARREYSIKNPNHTEAVGGWDNTTFLNKAKLTIRGGVTRATILLLGKPESSHWLNPASATITWILKKDRDSIAKDYEHFNCPLLLNAKQAINKIRILKYRYMKDYSLFPEEIDQYDPFVIREALNNAIAHQDYELGGKISVVEFEDGRLCFSNLGSFIPGTVENVIRADAPEPRYRNRFLTDAMVTLNMIDTIGSGIRKMFTIQSRRYFPLPEFEIANNHVLVTITGEVLDLNYARKLTEMPELALEDIILLDIVQKRKSLTNDQAAYLKSKNLIKGEKPYFYISSKVAKHVREKGNHRRIREPDENAYKKMICGYLEQYGPVRKVEIVDYLLTELPDVLDTVQKNNKAKNLLQALKKDGLIEPEGKSWRMSKIKS